jgi:hypothetical protein
MTTIIRHSPPTKLDIAPFGTKCFIEQSGGRLLYVQIGKDETDPEWDFVGFFRHDALDSDINSIVEHRIEES